MLTQPAQGFRDLVIEVIEFHGINSEAAPFFLHAFQGL